MKILSLFLCPRVIEIKERRSAIGHNARTAADTREKLNTTQYNIARTAADSKQKLNTSQHNSICNAKDSKDTLNVNQHLHILVSDSL